MFIMTRNFFVIFLCICERACARNTNLRPQGAPDLFVLFWKQVIMGVEMKWRAQVDLLESFFFFFRVAFAVTVECQWGNQIEYRKMLYSNRPICYPLNRWELFLTWSVRVRKFPKKKKQQKNIAGSRSLYAFYFLHDIFVSYWFWNRISCQFLFRLNRMHAIRWIHTTVDR